MKRVVVVCLLLAVTWAAQGQPGETEPTTTRESECFRCHFEGGSGLGPIMEDVFRIIPPKDLELNVGEFSDLEFTVRNWWTAELSGFQGHIDISGAPAFAFDTPPDPIMDQQVPGNLPFNINTGNERTTRVTFTVPDGETPGTDLAVRLVPDRQTGSQAPDLEMRVWIPGQDTSENPNAAIDRQGAGGTETWNLTQGPIPAGTYTIEVAQDTILGGTPTDQSKTTSQPFTVVWDLFYDFEAGDPIRFIDNDAVLDGQEPDHNQSFAISWSVALTEQVTERQVIEVWMQAEAYYNHAPQFQAVDEWLFWKNASLILEPPQDGSTEIIIETTVPEDDGPDLTIEDEVRLDIWSEVVGYVSVFLLVVSMVTGGVFGRWTARLQRFFLFRRQFKRIAFHNVVGYGLIIAATAHMVLFLVEDRYPWSVGFFLGFVSIVGIALAGITGAFQKPMIRGIGLEAWRWTHYLSYAMAFLGAAAHILLDGIHFEEFQTAVNWTDPVQPTLEQWIPTENTAPPELTGGDGNSTFAL